MYIKKAERWGIDAFELWCWRRLLDSKEIKPVNPKGNQSWIFTGRTDVEAEAPILRPPDAKSQLIRKDRCWERLRGRGEGDNREWDGWMASLTQWTWVWANWGDSERQGSLACCSLWDCKELDTTYRLNNNMGKEDVHSFTHSRNMYWTPTTP